MEHLHTNAPVAGSKRGAPCAQTSSAKTSWRRSANRATGVTQRAYGLSQADRVARNGGKSSSRVWTVACLLSLPLHVSCAIGSEPPAGCCSLGVAQIQWRGLA